MTDVSDHLPVFAVLEMNNSFNLTTRRTYHLVREKTPKAFMAFKAALSNHDWQEVYVENANDSYNAFFYTFLAFYNQHCPLKEFKQTSRRKGKPWLTKGLEKACKKKNRLYMDNNLLTYVLSTARLNAVGHRWVGELADFYFNIEYRPGKMNTDADTVQVLP